VLLGSSVLHVIYSSGKQWIPRSDFVELNLLEVAFSCS
jgi:hypothetical protein